MIWHALVFRAVRRAQRPSAPCPRCGHTVPAGRGTCPECGGVLPAPPAARGAGADRWALALFVGLLLAVLAYLVVTHDPVPPAGTPATQGAP